MARQGEFALIRGLFAPLAAAVPQALDLADDAAVLDTRELGDLVASVDALVAGVHFLPDDPPETIAAKCLRVNLSDLAAMGAAPVGLLMAAALAPDIDDAWMAAFTRGLEADLAGFGVALLGGDTVSTPGPATFSVTVLGQVPPGTALRRCAARSGDDLWVSGTLGDGALGLRALQGRFSEGVAAVLRPQDRDALIDRYRRPTPRLALGVALRGIARACMDVSDGLCGDVGHLCRASGVAVEIEAAALPLSTAARRLVDRDPALVSDALGGGDDYELVFTADPADRDRVAALADPAGVPVTRIGRVLAAPEGNGGTPVRVVDAEGSSVIVSHAGWSHGA